MFYPLSHILKTWRMKKWVGSYGHNIKHYWEHNLSQFFSWFFSENNVIIFANNKYQNMILTQMAKWRKCQKKLLPYSTAICRTKYHAQKIVMPCIQAHDPLKMYTHTKHQPPYIRTSVIDISERFWQAPRFSYRIHGDFHARTASISRGNASFSGKLKFTHVYRIHDLSPEKTKKNLEIFLFYPEHTHLMSKNFQY